MTDFAGLKVALCQMPVIPGRPDLNANYIIDEIAAAKGRGAHIAVFPEMCTAGYLIGDLYEDSAFGLDVRVQNERIREATKAGIAVIFGSLAMDPSQKGEDGRLLRQNMILTAQNGRWIHQQPKCLQPNYRIFDDDRYFRSLRKRQDEINERQRQLRGLSGPDWTSVHDLLRPFVLETPIGLIRAGVTICEDIWHEDYPHNPVKSLVANGAEIIFNISSSPWTWQKNRKRHQVIKKLLAECGVPLVYVNNTGIQNTGKNIVVFDGSSTVYNRQGDIVFEIKPYSKGTFDFTFSNGLPATAHSEPDDSAQLHLALKCAAEEFLKTFPPRRRKVVVGVSGGIDSSLAAAFYAHILGPENVILINMPMAGISSLRHRRLAQRLAENLGAPCETRPITRIVRAIEKASGVKPGTPAHENVQARARMEILAARAQELGAVFSANWNKVEAAFGYGTLYADMAGFLALFGDLVKREIYQLADYLNRAVFGREVIPRECFEIPPSAELARDQRDPFDYGNLERRGYHDEMVRAFTDFRLNPEWFLEKYIRGQLEQSLLLETGTLANLFPLPSDFVKDLEKQWRRFHGSFFKRIQGPPVPIVSKRAFGTDLRESMLSAHFTQRYHQLKRFLLARYVPRKRYAVYGICGNPPGRHHRLIAQKLAGSFDRVFIVLCGPRPDKPTAQCATPLQRRVMAEACFGNIPKVELDFYDIDHGVYTPTIFLDRRYRQMHPDAEIWHAIGEDIIAGGHEQNCEIHRVWHHGNEVWQGLNFAIIRRPGYKALEIDRPPHSIFIEVDGIRGSSTDIRELTAKGEDISDFVDEGVKKIIQQEGLYRDIDKC